MTAGPGETFRFMYHPTRCDPRQCHWLTKDVGDGHEIYHTVKAIMKRYSGAGIELIAEALGLDGKSASEASSYRVAHHSIDIFFEAMWGKSWPGKGRVTTVPRNSRPALKTILLPPDFPTCEYPSTPYMKVLESEVDSDRSHYQKNRTINVFVCAISKPFLLSRFLPRNKDGTCSTHNPINTAGRGRIIRTQFGKSAPVFFQEA